MGRPRKPLNAIIISCNGEAIGWTPEAGLTGSLNLKTLTQEAMNFSYDTYIPAAGGAVPASSDTHLGVYSAMLWACGGRGITVSLTEELSKELTAPPEYDYSHEGTKAITIRRHDVQKS